MGYFARLSWGVLSSYSSLKPSISEDGIIFSFFFTGYIISQIPAGFLADKFSPKYIIGAAMLGLAFATGLSGLAWTVTVETLASFATGFAAGWVYSPTVKVLASLFRKRELSVAVGYYSLAWPLSIILTGLVLPPLASSAGWRAPYYILAALSLVIAALVFSTGQSRVVREKIDFLVIRDPNVILLSVGGFAFYFAYWLLALYAYLYLLTLGLSNTEAGLVYSMLAVAGLPSTVISGHIMRRIGAKWTLSSSVVIYASLLLVFSFIKSIYGLLLVATVMGFFRFMITPAGTTVASLVGGPEKTGSVNGMTNFFAQASGAVGPLAASVIIERLGYNAVWFLAFGLSVLAAFMFARLKV